MMPIEKKYQARRPAQKILVRACSASLLLLLGACAMVPEASDLPTLRSEASYASSATLSGAVTDWPPTDWWKNYGDEQLDLLMTEGLAGATDIKVAAARLMAADAVIRQERSSLYPSLTANGEAGAQKQSYNYIMPGDFAPRGWKDYGQLTTTLNWDLDFWGRNRAAFASSLSERAAAEAEQAAARLTVSAGIADAYADLASLHARRQTAEAAISIRQATLALMQKRYTLDLENKGAVHRARSLLAVSQGELSSLNEEIALTQNRLAALVGAGPDRARSIKAPNMTDIRSHGVPADLTVNFIAHRPDIIAAKYRAEAAAARIKVARAAFMPDISLSAMVGLQSMGFDSLFKSGSTFGSVGPAIDLPLFDAGRRKGRYRQAEAVYAQAVEEYNGLIVDALHQVADTLTSFRSLNQRRQHAQAAEKAAQAAWQVARDRYQGGLATYLDVLTAEDTLISTKRAVSVLDIRGFALDVSLTRALGGGYKV